MLYLRPALKYFCSLSLHEDFIYDADPSFVNKVEKIKIQQQKNPNVNSLFFICLLSKMFVSPSHPLNDMHLLFLPQARRRPPLRRPLHSSIRSTCGVMDKAHLLSPCFDFEIRFVSSSC